LPADATAIRGGLPCVILADDDIEALSEFDEGIIETAIPAYANAGDVYSVPSARGNVRCEADISRFNASKRNRASSPHRQELTRSLLAMMRD
jgi:hypothetical protein